MHTIVRIVNGFGPPRYYIIIIESVLRIKQGNANSKTSRRECYIVCLYIILLLLYKL